MQSIAVISVVASRYADWVTYGSVRRMQKCNTARARHTHYDADAALIFTVQPTRSHRLAVLHTNVSENWEDKNIATAIKSCRTTVPFSAGCWLIQREDVGTARLTRNSVVARPKVASGRGSETCECASSISGANLATIGLSCLVFKISPRDAYPLRRASNIVSHLSMHKCSVFTKASHFVFLYNCYKN